MRKKFYSYFELILAMSLISDNPSVYGYRRKKHLSLVEKKLTKAQKEERHRIYSGDQTKHKFTINGVVITACNKKTAIKIYKRLMASQKT